MTNFRLWTPVVLGALACGGFFLACSSSSSDSGGGNNGNNTGVDSSVAPSSCTNGTLKVVFAPMYSAFDGTHTFQIPAILDPAPSGEVKWAASDPSMVAIAPDNTTGGVMLTTQKAGSVTITATVGDQCGTSVLNITSATPDDWNAGNERYNNGNVIRLGPPPDGGFDAAGFDAEARKQLECTNCHGDNANTIFKDVAHTPEQTGGFSDEDLINIFTKGVVPDGGYFDPNIVSYQRWQNFHQWDMTPDEAKGLVIYLRSLTPEAQNGSSNFGGRRDGGGGDGGRRRDGGGGPPDATAAADATGE